MDQHKYYACSIIDRNNDSLHKLSRTIWAYAETGKKEFKTSKALTYLLKKNNFKITQPFKGIPTAFIAEFGEREFGGSRKPNIAVVCQYDAVKGKGHIRGNNLVAEVAVATALGLQEAIRCSTAKIGKVTVIGCPNSEDGGVIPLINRGAFKGYDIALGAIPGPRTEWGPTSLSKKTLRAIYRAPEESKKDKMPCSPLDGAVLAHSNIQSVRSHFGKGWKTEEVIPQGGRKPLVDVTEGEALVKMTGPSYRDVALTEKRVVPCLEAAAHASGCEVDVTVGEKIYHNLVVSPTLSYLLQLNAYHCGVLATPLEQPETLEFVDFANVSHLMPTLRPMFYVGAKHQVGTLDFKTHVRTYQAHLHAIAISKALAMTALDMMHTSGALDNARAEIREEIQRQRKVTFAAFPVRKHSSKIKFVMDIPGECNIGWSKQP